MFLRSIVGGLELNKCSRRNTNIEFCRGVERPPWVKSEKMPRGNGRVKTAWGNDMGEGRERERETALHTPKLYLKNNFIPSSLSCLTNFFWILTIPLLLLPITLQSVFLWNIVVRSFWLVRTYQWWGFSREALLVLAAILLWFFQKAIYNHILMRRNDWIFSVRSITNQNFFQGIFNLTIDEETWVLKRVILS